VVRKLDETEAAGSPAASAAYSFAGPLATIHDPAFFRVWVDDEAYAERLIAAEDSEVREVKRIAVEFQRQLAQVVGSGDIAGGIDALLEKFIDEGYKQHDGHLTDGRGPLAAFFKGAAQTGVDLWPPMPICVVVEGDIAALLLEATTPDGGRRNIPTMFRVGGGRMTEHWSAAAPPPGSIKP
jgi:predicted SnoaL-like aldol condensation-catalyzing enzyme